MGMTERQGGADVRANTSQARRVGGHYAITGHKWFMSAPMCDAFLVLAQASGGLTCFLLPRFRPDGSLNRLHFQRLKDKLGNRSNASSEVEFDAAYGERIGEEGRGVRTIIQMVQLTRLDCVVASAGLMRFGLASAAHHARHRSVFQKKLIDQPAMRAVLADMALEVEAVTALALRLAAAFDAARADPAEAAYARLLTPAVKYYVCKIAPGLLYEAMECHGGNGYVEGTAARPRLSRGPGERDLGRLGQCRCARRPTRRRQRSRNGGCSAGAHRRILRSLSSRRSRSDDRRTARSGG